MEEETNILNDPLYFLLFLLAFCIGMIFIVAIFPNVNSDIGLSQEAGNIICQTITNNSNVVAVDWNHKYNQPIDSLVCKIVNDERIGDGLIQVINKN